MKRIVMLVLALVLVVAMLPMSVSARTLTAQEKEIFKKLRDGVAVEDGLFSIPEETIVAGENYLMAHDQLTNEQISAIIAEIDSASQKVVLQGTHDVAKWSQQTKDGVLENIDKAAQQLIVNKGTENEHTLRARANEQKSIQIYDPNPVGGASAVVVEENHLDPIKKTGTDITAFVIAGLCGIALLSGCVIVSKKVELF